MTAFTWRATDRQVVGVSADPGDDTPVVLQWGVSGAAGSTLPWATPEYPTLLVHHIGFDLIITNDDRSVLIELLEPAGGRVLLVNNTVNSTPGVIDRWEWCVGIIPASQNLAAGGTLHIETIPRGLMLLPGWAGEAASTLTISVPGPLSGPPTGVYNLGPVTISGSLLYL